VVAHGNLFEYFREHVEEAVERQRAPVSPSAVYYLSSLLADAGRLGRGEDPPADTLVELRQRAANAPLGEAIGLWRRLGDRSLLVLGFFGENLARRAISREYWAGMGSAAYGTLHRLLPDAGEGPAVFGELADRYDACAEVLRDVRDEARERTDADIVRLYEEWLATGSPRVGERLRELGVVPGRFGGSA
jgi:hypothetical protein